ncbi:MAG: Bug family tripartite tricarboxylate transporter substrate binding protein [Pseudorhodoplanes sp.]|uniref:Bug family tripartite tricarboxylate transporter substrate binding protein n=1 Tax=Pseudorhodoplanes sp. TaxID=1934341 RepID=UPI003D0A0479
MKSRFWLAAAALLLAWHSASAQSWPTQPIRWIVPYPAGGGTDLLARALAPQLEKSLGQPIVVENKPGASTVTGTAALTQAEPDGHTVGMVFDSLAINAAFDMKLPYDSEKDITPVIELARVPLVLIVNSQLVPMKSLPELIAHSKANPGWFTFGSLGPGSPHEVGFAWLKTLTKMDALIVPYRGVGPALQDLVAGQIKGMYLGVAVAEEFIKAGKLHPIAVSSPERLKSAPQIPTVAEQGYPGYDFVTFYGLAAPRGTPAPIVQRLNQAVNDALKSPEIRARIAPTGAELVGGTPEAFGIMLKNNLGKMKQIVSSAGLKR